MAPPQWETSSDVIGAGEDDRASSAGRPAAAGRTRWLPLGLAFVVGIVVGAAGWDRVREFWDERSRRSAVSVAAELGTVFGPARSEGERTISVVARLRNSGPLPIEIVDLRLDIPGLEAPPGARPTSLTLQPGRTESLRFARVLRCEELAVAGDEPLIVRARTADGRVREQRLVLTEDVRRIGDFAKAQCERRDLDQISFFIGDTDWTAASWERRQRVVRSTLAVSAATQATITGIDSDVFGWEAEADDLPVSLTPDIRQNILIVWRIEDCSGARRFELSELRVEVLGLRAGGRQLITEVPVDQALVTQLGRLLDSECA